MFIPNVNIPIEEHQMVILRNDISLHWGVFTRGHIFTVIHLLKDKKFLVEDSDNRIITVDRSDISPNLPYEQSE